MTPHFCVPLANETKKIVINRSSITAIAADFWAAAGGRDGYGEPVAITSAITVALRLAPIPIADLTFAKADEFLMRIGGPQRAPGGEQPLQGLIVADLDMGFLFFDPNDSEEEQRVTIAHEAAHNRL